MKILKYNEDIFAMANVNKRRTGLNVNIWSDGQGVLRNKSDVIPRVKLIDGDDEISISIEETPRVLAPKDWEHKFKKSTIKNFEDGIDYVARNYDLFLRHYMDTDLSFDDQDLFLELQNRGEFK